jgi:DNA-directed RNA polymerase II subunit RPB2
MVHRLCNAALGRVPEDDRDHYGKKRLDLAGSLLGSLFRNLFRRFVEDARDALMRQVNQQESMNLMSSLKSNTIT